MRSTKFKKELKDAIHRSLTEYISLGGNKINTISIKSFFYNDVVRGKSKEIAPPVYDILPNDKKQGELQYYLSSVLIKRFQMIFGSNDEEYPNTLLFNVNSDELIFTE